MGLRPFWRGAADSPAVQVVAVTVAAVVFVVARLEVVAHGDITRFIDVGSTFANRRAVPRGVTIVPGSGYDGEFYYRLALDPLDLHRRADGITMDNAYRVQRITYSALAWLLGAGQASAIPYTLVAVNVAALGALAWFGGLLARDCGRLAAWGLLLPGYFGFLFSIGRDLTEVCEACFVVAGLLCLRRGRPVLAGASFTAAVLSRETALVVVAGVAVVALADLARARRRPGGADVAWVLPIAACVVWQLVGWVQYGSIPFRSDSENNLAPPFASMIGALGHYASELPSEHALIWLAQLGVLAFVVVSAATVLRSSRATTAEKWGFVLALALVLCISRNLWYSHADFRGFEDLYVLATVVLLGSERRLRVVGALVAVMWVATFAHRVVYF